MSEFQPREFLTAAEIEALAETGYEIPREAIDAMIAQKVEGPWEELVSLLDAGALKGWKGHVIDDGNQLLVVWESGLEEASDA